VCSDRARRITPVDLKGAPELVDTLVADTVPERSLKLHERLERSVDAFATFGRDNDQLGASAVRIGYNLNQTSRLKRPNDLVDCLASYPEFSSQVDLPSALLAKTSKQHGLRRGELHAKAVGQNCEQRLLEPAEPIEEETGEVRVFSHRERAYQKIVKSLDILCTVKYPDISSPLGEAMTTMTTDTVRITIDAPFEQVVADLADPMKQPEWATEFFAGPARETVDG